MAQHITVVQARHGDFRNDHLKKGREGGKDAKLVRCKTKACRSGEVSTFHDSGGNKHFGMSLVDDLQTSRTLQIACASRGLSTKQNLRSKNDTNCR